MEEIIASLKLVEVARSKKEDKTKKSKNKINIFSLPIIYKSRNKHQEADTYLLKRR